MGGECWPRRQRDLGSVSATVELVTSSETLYLAGPVCHRPRGNEKKSYRLLDHVGVTEHWEGSAVEIPIVQRRKLRLGEGEPVDGAPIERRGG